MTKKKPKTPAKHSAVARDLRTPKYKMRVKPDETKKITRGSGNVFKDLQLENAADLFQTAEVLSKGYGGYRGSAEYSVEDKSWAGKILGIKDLVSYEAKDLAKLGAAFMEAVDDYIAFRKSKK